MKKIRIWLINLRFIIPSILIKPDTKPEMDLKRWKEVHRMQCSDRKALAYFLWYYKEFRNLIYRQNAYPLRRRVFSLFYPPLDSLFLDTPQIGGDYIYNMDLRLSWQRNPLEKIVGLTNK